MEGCQKQTINMKNNIYNNFAHLWAHIEVKHKNKLYLLLIFMFLTSILEVVSIIHIELKSCIKPLSVCACVLFFFFFFKFVLVFLKKGNLKTTERQRERVAGKFMQMAYRWYAIADFTATQ